MFVMIFYLILVNLVAAGTMFFDKRRAIKRGRRVSEKTLFLLAWIGGSFGIITGMYIFRHKTKKVKFTAGVPAILAVQIFVGLWVIL